LERERHAELALAFDYRAHVIDLESVREPEARPRVVRPRARSHEERERAHLLRRRRGARDGVVVRLEDGERPVRAAVVVRHVLASRTGRSYPAELPAAILRRSSALSSVSSSTPCLRATSRSVPPEAEASLTISAARS